MSLNDIILYSSLPIAPIIHAAAEPTSITTFVLGLFAIAHLRTLSLINKKEVDAS